MIKLKRLMESEDSDNSDLYDNWYEYLRDICYAIEKSEISKLIHRFNLSEERLMNGVMIKLSDDKREAYLLYDDSNETFDFIKDISQWLYDLNSYEYCQYIDPDLIYNGWVDSNLKDVKTNPGKVYHWTTEENFEKINQTGKVIGSRGSGINNTDVFGIFTSINPEEYASGVYGNICLELDLQRFLQDSGKSELNLAWEPQVEEYLVREYLRHVLEITNDRDDIESDGGISPTTIVVNEVIPIQYAKQI
jgi:hypothetical protein